MTQRHKLWTSDQFTVGLAAIGQAGQVVKLPLTGLRAGLDLSHLAGYTILDTRIDGLIHSDDAETGAGFLSIHYGLIIAPGSMDAGDFPDVALYEGDYFHWGVKHVQLPGGAVSLVLPPENAIISSRSRAMRRITDVGQSLWLVFQEDVAEGVDVEVTITSLVMMP